ncbi:MAG: hypothetical protein SGI72_08340 [Planctomycetota bacterium]|nr:hypothetical protein [Planctomycetota bacterium]
MLAEREPAAVLSRSLARSLALHRAGRVVEALALGWLSAAVVFAAITASTSVSLARGPSSTLDSSVHAQQAWIAVLCVGLLVAAATWTEHMPKPREHLRRVDGRLNFDGALVTASDVSKDDSSGPLARILVRDVVLRLRTTDLARASLPSTPLALVAVVLGLAIVFSAREFAAREGAHLSVRTSAHVSEADRAALTEAARSLIASEPRGAQAASAVDAERSALALDLAAAANAPYLDSQTKTELAERVKRAISDPSIDASERAKLADAARALGVPLQADVAGAPANSSSNTGLESDSVASALASGDSLGKLSGPDPRTHESNSSLTPEIETRGAERGVGSIRWWPARHDAVVEAWLASTPRQK